MLKRTVLIASIVLNTLSIILVAVAVVRMWFYDPMSPGWLAAGTSAACMGAGSLLTRYAGTLS